MKRQVASKKMLATITRDAMLPGTITPTGWTPPTHPLSFAQWQASGEALARVTANVRWLIADWWAYGEHAYGERIEALRNGLFGDLSFRTLKTYGWVARSVAPISRLDVLSFKHHMAVAALPPAMQRLLLEHAASERLSTRELRAIVAQERRAHNGAAEAIAADAVAVSDGFAGCPDRDGDGFPLPPVTDDALRARLNSAAVMLGRLINKPVEKFLSVRPTPERLRAIARFLETVADAVERKTISVTEQEAH
jgi:hypothetical protein